MELVFKLIYKTALELLDNPNIVKQIFPSKFLNYDPNFLCKAYRNERALDGRIPYREEVSWIGSALSGTIGANGDIKIRRIEGNFKLEHDSVQLRSFQGAAYSAFTHSKGLPRDTDVIRLDSVDISDGKTTLIIQKAKYSDQVQSNLVMDWPGPHALKEDSRIETLRAYMSGTYPNSLPSFADKRLANTIGISVILFYKNEGGFLVPYLPKRSKGILKKKKILAVHEGGFNCSASGAAEWNHDPSQTFQNTFVADMLREIEEEVGIYPDEIKVITPLALCREFLRGGKPQIFFGGVVDLSLEDLIKKRKAAIKRQATGDKIEIEDDQLIIDDFDQFKHELPQKGITLEAIANLYYADKFIGQYPDT
jgi:hypothetical protein